MTAAKAETDRPSGGRGDIGLVTVLGYHRRRVAQYTIWLALASMPFLAMAWVVRWGVDEADGDGRHLTLVVVLIGVLAAAAFVGHRQTGRAIGALTTEVRADVDTRLAAGLLARYVGDPRTQPVGGSELSRYSNLFAGLLMGLTQGLFGIAAGVALALGVVVAVPPLAVFVLVMVAVACLLAAACGHLLAPVEHEMMVLKDESSQRLAVGIAAVRDVVAFDAGDLVLDRAADVFRRDARAGARVVERVALVSMLSAAASLTVIVAALLTATDLRADGELTDGQVIAGIGQIVSAQLVLASLGEWAGKVIATNRALRDRIDERTGQRIQTRRDGTEPDPRLELGGVSFAWGATPIVSELDLTIEPGEHLAIVGPSGIGKSTLASLMAGVIGPHRGAILLGGHDVTTHPSSQRTIALLPQESYVFRGTLRENLTLLSPSASDAEVERAIAEVGLLRVVERLGGLDHEVSPATSGLSSGEQQLICLARVWLSPARIVLLDEGTCYLDPATEANAERSLRDRPGTTLIVVAHRISSAMRADRIAVMDGHRVAVGTHADLLLTSPLYQQLHGAWTETPGSE